MNGEYAPKTDGEMDCRRARRLKKEIVSDFPQLAVEVWPIAQGLAYLRVAAPLTAGVVTLVLHTEREVAEFRQLAAAFPSEKPAPLPYGHGRGRGARSRAY